MEGPTTWFSDWEGRIKAELTRLASKQNRCHEEFTRQDKALTILVMSKTDDMKSAAKSLQDLQQSRTEDMKRSWTN